MELEEKVLREISKRHVVRKNELKNFFKNFKKENLEEITEKLSRKGLITQVSIIGESWLAITQKGMRELEK